jgi:hypothetical protein
MSIHCTRSAKRDQADLFLFARFKTHSGTSGNVQAHPKGSLPIKLQRGVDLEKVVMAAYLDWPVTGVPH